MGAGTSIMAAKYINVDLIQLSDGGAGISVLVLGPRAGILREEPASLAVLNPEYMCWIGVFFLIFFFVVFLFANVSIFVAYL